VREAEEFVAGQERRDARQAPRLDAADVRAPPRSPLLPELRAGVSRAAARDGADGGARRRRGGALRPGRPAGAAGRLDASPVACSRRSRSSSARRAATSRARAHPARSPTSRGGGASSRRRRAWEPVGVPGDGPASRGGRARVRRQRRPRNAA
jgi:hypothetical protein